MGTPARRNLRLRLRRAIRRAAGLRKLLIATVLSLVPGAPTVTID
jgi:hypothetical protein